MPKHPLIYLFLAGLFLLGGCTDNNLADVNMTVAENNWLYAQPVKTSFEVKDSTKAYQIYFKIRNTAAYRYNNLYVIMRMKANGTTKAVRYQFKMAGADGQWMGQGSGDIYANKFLLLKNYHFTRSGKYEIEIEQNMRDNPLAGISDVGISVENIAP